MTAVPAAPSRPEAARVEAGVRLTWEGESPNETFFKVQRSIDGAVTFETLGRVGANVTSFLDDAAEDGTEFIYRVRAANDIRFSDRSSVLVE